MRMPCWILILASCRTEAPAALPPEPEPEPEGTTPAEPADADQDGVTAEVDCDDGDPAVFPGAPDRCGDDRVTDCDRSSDDGLVTVDGDATFDDLEDALAAASPGSEVVVCPGTWTGPFVVAVPLVLRSHAGPDATVLDGRWEGTTLSVPAGSTVTGFTIGSGHAPTGGGLLQTSSGPLTVTDCIVDGNQGLEGGGVALAENSDVVLTGTRILRNQARLAGGLLVPVGTTVDLADTTIEDNTAVDAGGIFVVDGTLLGGVVDSNTSTGSSEDATWGGGGVAVGGTVEIVGTWILNNLAEIGGGLSAVDANLEATDVRIHRNTGSERGGGAYLLRSEVVFAGTTELTENAAWSSGGGASVKGGRLTGGRIAGSAGPYWGGGLSLWDAHTVDVVVEENQASNGGGVDANGTSSLTGGRIVGNVAVGPAAGIDGTTGALSVEGDVVLDGVEVTDNSAGYNGGIDVMRGTLTVRGSTILRNTATHSSGGALVLNGRLSSVDSDWGAGADDNVPSDIVTYFGGEFSGYAAAATFDCNEQGCTPDP